MNILIAEDDPNIREGLETFLAREGFQPHGACDGVAALELALRVEPEFVILDVMMPRMGGYDVCRELRKRDPDVPILFLSARGEEVDRVVGLELGADDYLVKPFGTRELLARMNAILRRSRRAIPVAAESEETFSMGDLEILPSQLRARRGDQTIDLGPRDLAVLRLLWKKSGKVVDRQELFETCWGASFPGSTRSVDQHLSQLRRKIELDAADPKIIRTVHGAGYRFEPPRM
ncbi:MAG: response regulator transcription factor [Fibrobacterota bacterium]|nr:MAG: response regulator transcription factor [Fibrobacterota bacterium]